MSVFIPRLQKVAKDGAEVRLCVDGHLAWFVERPVDREAGAHPMGAFRSEEAAKTWADRHLPGGEWAPYRED